MRYFFSIRDASGLIPDEEGSDHGNLAQALLEAEASARDLAKQYIDSGLPLIGTVEVRDARGVFLAAVPIAAVLAPARPSGTFF